MADFTLKTLAIVPARAGSKRLPGKNLLPLQGKPLVQWTLDAALASEKIDRVLVTSDDPNLLKLADQLGCMTLLRPTELATDTASTYSVLQHALEHLDDQHVYPEQTLLLQPTSPLRSTEDINKGLALMEEKNANSIISVCPVDHPVQWCNTLDEECKMDNFIKKETLGLRSQDMPVHYRLNGAFYLAKTPLLMQHKGFFMPESYALIMNQENSVDIDTELDFLFCQTLLKQKQIKKETA
ncbi:cytidylyltransferase domain-containing protein [Marinospirillum alkaliphilum]|uniref:N-acylneuraminate cytidylyltransferase n=1 Tax=Marinospirillum alkaliphilum DSM 21637 TaxID=1122209 RepID=A0A1K1VII4_9GAMM|nr:acylneuraminate cytidylyltransferase family protein [Marinospirillum alkaliphilum]SFX24946.1 N-acylneuraminate cytidylyltransferase [Marinospirillum alkaliphilum DSM 21637]